MILAAVAMTHVDHEPRRQAGVAERPDRLVDHVAMVAVVQGEAIVVQPVEDSSRFAIALDGRASRGDGDPRILKKPRR